MPDSDDGSSAEGETPLMVGGAVDLLTTGSESFEEMPAPKHPIRKGLERGIGAANRAVEGVQRAGRSAGHAAGGMATAGMSTTGAVLAAATDVGAKAAATVKASAISALEHVGDLNGDGRVDEEDLRIARAALGQAAAGVGKEAATLGRAVIRHDVVKDAVAGAVVGAAIASVVPLVGTSAGAAFGATLAVTRGVLGRPASSTVAGKLIDTATDGAVELARTAGRTTSKRQKAK